MKKSKERKNIINKNKKIIKIGVIFSVK